jgi:biopolymer transport protein ExbD
MQFKQRRELKRTKIEIIPMIDTIFFLLVFFMLSSLALVKLNGLPVDLPKAASAQKQQSNNLTITIDKNQQVYVNKLPVRRMQLGPTLVSQAGANANLTTASVVINADARVPYSLVIQCIDITRQVGISSFSLATAPEDSSANQSS